MGHMTVAATQAQCVYYGGIPAPLLWSRHPRMLEFPSNVPSARQMAPMVPTRVEHKSKLTTRQK